MSNITTDTKFITSDDQQFDSLEAAEAWQDILEQRADITEWVLEEFAKDKDHRYQKGLIRALEAWQYRNRLAEAKDASAAVGQLDILDQAAGQG